jgi:hypothetical protein
MAFSLPVFLHIDRRVGDELEADPAPKPKPLPSDALTRDDDRAWFDLWGTHAGIPPDAQPPPSTPPASTENP